MRARFIPFVVVSGLLLAGCRSCADDAAKPRGGGPQPPMPTGMLAPSPAASGSAVDGGAAMELRLARNVKSGSWVELQVAPEGDRPDRTTFERFRADSVFVPLEAMTIMHDAFARALSGFDLFLPRLFSPEALTRLAAELGAFEKDLSVGAAAREIADLARDLAGKGKSLWVLGF